VLPGVELAFAIDGSDHRATTNGSGVAQITASAASAGVRAANVDALRRLLEPRWANPPASPDLGALADAVAVAIRAGAEPITVTAGQRTKIVFRRKVSRVRLVGMHFDTAKCFLLPSAMTGIRAIVEIYKDYPNASLLITGHTDTHYAGSGDGDAYNLELSRDRAEAVAAYLTDNRDGWYLFYGASGEKQWGLHEDGHMLSALPEGGAPYYADGKPLWKALHDYQDAKGFKRTENPDKKTRQALIADYMALDGTSLPAGAGVATQGYGYHHPADPGTGDDADAKNRRVEVFVFDGPVPDPLPPYEELDALPTDTYDFELTDAGMRFLDVRFYDRQGDLMSSTWYRFGGNAPRQATDGWGRVHVPAIQSSVEVEWGGTGAGGAFPYSMVIDIDVTSGTEEEQATKMLGNLGYKNSAYESRVRMFQYDYDLQEVGLDNGALRPKTKQKLWALFDSATCDATPPPPKNTGSAGTGPTPARGAQP
jgi:outer membrane protein OmpA-like peptidoglycan-associated protein